MVGSAMVFAASTGSGRGKVLAILGPRTAASAPSLPVPLRSRKRPKARMPASARISERLLMASARHVAPIGFDGLRRQVALGAEMPQPSLDLRRNFGGDSGRFFRHASPGPAPLASQGRMNKAVTPFTPTVFTLPKSARIGGQSGDG